MRSPYLLLPLVLLHALSVNGDSGALTSGHDAERRSGVSRRHHGAAFDGRLRPLGRSAHGASAIALDAAGGPNSASGWTAAFALLAVGIVLGPAGAVVVADAGVSRQRVQVNVRQRLLLSLPIRLHRVPAAVPGMRCALPPETNATRTLRVDECFACPHDALTQHNRRALHLRGRGQNLEHVVHARRLQKLDLHRAHDESKTRRLALRPPRTAQR